MFLVRHWLGFRSGNVTELGKLDDFYVPSTFPGLSDERANELTTKITNFYGWICNFHKKLVDQGVSPHQADILMPQGMWTEFCWTVSARGLMDFLSVRLEYKGELAEYAQALFDLFQDSLPLTAAEFQKQLNNGAS